MKRKSTHVTGAALEFEWKAKKISWKTGQYVCIISHLEYILWPETCDSQEWLVSNACCRGQLCCNMHGHQSLQLVARLDHCDYYCTKSNGPAETFAFYQGICTTKLSIDLSNLNIFVNWAFCVSIWIRYICFILFFFFLFFYFKMMRNFLCVCVSITEEGNACREGHTINTHNECSHIYNFFFFFFSVSYVCVV